MDCLSHGCVFAKALTGMRTNGGCNCIEWGKLTPAKRIALREFAIRARALEAVVDSVRYWLEANDSALYGASELEEHLRALDKL